LWLQKLGIEGMINVNQELRWWKKFMAGGKDFSTALGGMVLGILGGILAAAVLDALLKPKCPICKEVIQRGVPTCPHCGSFLQWGSQ